MSGPTFPSSAETTKRLVGKVKILNLVLPKSISPIVDNPICWQQSICWHLFDPMKKQHIWWVKDFRNSSWQKSQHISFYRLFSMLRKLIVDSFPSSFYFIIQWLSFIVINTVATQSCLIFRAQKQRKKIEWGQYSLSVFDFRFLSVCFSGRFLRIKIRSLLNLNRNFNEKLARVLKSSKLPICWRNTRYVDNSLYVDRFWVFWKSNICDDALNKASRIARGNWWSRSAFQPLGSLEVIGRQDFLPKPLASLEVISGQDSLSEPLASLEVIAGPISSS